MVNLNIILIDQQGKQIDASRIKLEYDSVNVNVPVFAVTENTVVQ